MPAWAVVVIVVALVALVLIGVLMGRGHTLRGKVTGPLGTGGEFSTTQDRDRVRQRNVKAGRDVQGRASSVDQRDIDAGRDVIAQGNGGEVDGPKE